MFPGSTPWEGLLLRNTFDLADDSHDSYLGLGFPTVAGDWWISAGGLWFPLASWVEMGSDFRGVIFRWVYSVNLHKTLRAPNGEALQPVPPRLKAI